jgi:hypothetical protein
MGLHHNAPRPKLVEGMLPESRGRCGGAAPAADLAGKPFTTFRARQGCRNFPHLCGQALMTARTAISNPAEPWFYCVFSSHIGLALRKTQTKQFCS